MIKRCVMLLAALFTFATVSVWAQSNEVLDKVLAAGTANFGQAAYLVLASISKIPDSASSADAVTALQSEPWGIKAQSPDSPVTLGTYSFMVMKALGISGGIMYHLFPGPRYAARELAYLGIVHGDASPYRVISGEEAVQILGGAMSLQGSH